MLTTPTRASDSGSAVAAYRGADLSSAAYEPRSAEDTALHQVVVEHLETFLEEARARDGGSGVPAFVERGFRKLVECGCLARGFARVRCDTCGFERLVPFSCKVRGLCPSCSGRRMAELSAHLVDAVLPPVPVRQWVLTLPYPLRYALAWNHERTRGVLGVVIRAVEGFYRRKAKEQGVADGRGGAVTVIQRCGSALNVNPHFHVAVLDGVFARAPGGELNFHALESITDEEVEDLLGTVRRRVLRWLERNGALDEDDRSINFDELSDESPSLAGMYSASVRGHVSMGERAGRQVARVGSDPDALWVESQGRLQAHLEGFDLHAGTAVAAGDTERLERLCRYVLRPPVVQDRLELLEDGRVMLELKNEFRDGTTHLVFEPLELMERLASIIPRPRVNLLIYHGILAPNAKWREEVVWYGHGGSASQEGREVASAHGTGRVSGDDQGDSDHRRGARRSYTWAELMRRAFLVDVLDCPRCHGRMRVIATIDEPAVVKKILEHLGLPTEIPSPRPARPPPEEQEILPDYEDF